MDLNISLISQTTFDINNYVSKTIDELRDIVINYEPLTYDEMYELIDFEDSEYETLEEFETYCEQKRKLMLMRHRYDLAQMGLDPYFIWHNKENCIRAIELDYIINELY